MVDFSNKTTDSQTQIAPDSRPLEAVTHQGEIDALGPRQPLARGISSAVGVGADYVENAAKGANNKFLADFQSNLSNLQNAQDQGLSAQEVRTRGRLMLTQALTNNPNAQEDIVKSYGTWLNQSGVANVDSPDVARAKIHQDTVKSAVDNGFLPASQVGNPAAEDAAVQKLSDFQATVKQLDLDTKNVALQGSRLDLNDKQRQDAKNQAQDKVEISLSNVAAKALPYWQAQYQNIQDAADKAQDPTEKAQIIAKGITQLKTDFAQRTAAMAGDGLATNQAKLDQILKPQADLIDAYTKKLDGTYDTDAYNKAADGAMARANALAVGKLSEQSRVWVATSKMTQVWGSMLDAKLGGVMADIMATNDKAGKDVVDPPVNGGPNAPTVTGRVKPYDTVTDDPAKTKDIKDYFTNMSKILDSRASGNTTPEADAELDTQMKGIFKGTIVHGNAAESAKEFQPTIDFFASPSVGKYLIEKGGVPAAIRPDLSGVLQSGYGNEVIPLLHNELDKMFSSGFTDAGRGFNKPVPLSDIVQPSMDTGQFGFALKPGVPVTLASQLAVKKLNDSTFTQVFNKLIKSNAHIGGSNDYKKSFETFSPYLFPDASGATQEAPKADTHDKTSLNDLVHTNNPDVVQEVLNAKNNDPSLGDLKYEPGPGLMALVTSGKRGNGTPDTEDIQPAVKQDLSKLQVAFGKQIPIVSGFRDPARNAAAGGAEHSQHMSGNAVDLDVADLGRGERVRLIQLAKEQGFTGIGVYPNSLHLDKGPVRAWGPSYHRDSLPNWAAIAIDGSSQTASN